MVARSVKVQDVQLSFGEAVEDSVVLVAENSRHRSELELNLSLETSSVVAHFESVRGLFLLVAGRGIATADVMAGSDLHATVLLNENTVDGRSFH